MARRSPRQAHRFARWLISEGVSDYKFLISLMCLFGYSRELAERAVGWGKRVVKERP